MKKVLITGSAGFIGFHLSQKLVKEGFEIVGIDNINDYYDVSLKYGRLEQQGIDVKEIQYGKVVKGDGGISFVQLDITDQDKVEQLFEDHGFEWVVHLAAQAGVGYSLKNPHAYIESNVTGFLNLCEAAKKVPPEHFVFASSSSVYGLNQAIPFRESQHTDHPISLYAATKKSSEMLAHTYAHLYGIPMTGLRFFTVYGPWGRPDMALFIFTEKILKGKPIQVFNHGDMMRDFTYIDDIVNGIADVGKAIPQPNPKFDHADPIPNESSAPYRILNIGNHHPTQLMEFIRVLEAELQQEAEIEYKPMQPGDVKETYADVDALKKTAGYEPGTPVKKGVKAFVYWYRSFDQI